MFAGFFLSILSGMFITIKLACCAFLLGLPIGIIGAMFQSIPNKGIRYVVEGILFIMRGLPELLILFFIYFGMTVILSALFHQYVDINAFIAGFVALGLIFGAYASQVFRGAFLAVDRGQVEAGMALNLNRFQIFLRITLPQALRHAIPGLGNLWLILLKDTAIVSLIGVPDMMSEAKLAASSTHQPFTFYLIVAFIYLMITTVSQIVINYYVKKENRYLPTS